VRAKSAEIDAERRYFLDYDKLNDGRTREPERAASRRWAFDLSAILEAVYAFLGVL